MWNACGYVRLSREDGDKEESNSVTGQKDLIRDYMARRPELRDCGMKVDDGYTGSNFDRPAFQELMAEVRAGTVNCIVVKDLSRFGRDHLEAGEYLERVFPFLGVRFIAINDRYDSLHSHGDFDELLLPFKNLVNEAYCRDISIKIRSQLEIKRQRGDHIGAFAVYGYRKDPADHHRLLVDDCAAGVVRDVFKWKLEGVSAGEIAARLNGEGILTPMDYKWSQGLRFTTAFRTKEVSAWSAGMVLRLLKDPVYTGVLVQGRVTTPSYKVKRLVKKPREEWAVVENCHEPIIDRDRFEDVQRVLAMDTRTGTLFSGLVRCGECGGTMVRKTVPSGGRRYVYYVCAAHKETGTCSAHGFRADALEEVVLETLQDHIRAAVGGLPELPDPARLRQAGERRLRERLERAQAEADRYQMLLDSLDKSLADGLIDQEEYDSLQTRYAHCRANTDEHAKALREKLEGSVGAGEAWVEQFREGRGVAALDRAMVIALIERILIFRGRRMEIVFRWRDEFR